MSCNQCCDIQTHILNLRAAPFHPALSLLFIKTFTRHFITSSAIYDALKYSKKRKLHIDADYRCFV